ncbi:MAG: hypothetical protein KGQ57_20195, partial [Burkholderiales bacterium]|nr:hypothetical protein [Burkholderiales bacterium]
EPGIGNDSNKEAPMGDSAPPSGKRPINARQPTSVLKPLKGIVGELRTRRGNKVFQVVTPAR